MDAVHSFVYETALGKVTVAADDTGLTALRFGEESAPGEARERTPLTDRAAAELAEYFAGKRKEFDLPLHPRGTEFQRRVWEALRAIPCGETRSYRQIAEAVGNPRACRAVGMANNRNPLPIFIPCHRVIGADGKLIGYAGGLSIKKKLLKLEEEWEITRREAERAR